MPTSIGDVRRPDYPFNLAHRTQVRAEPAMNTEYLVVDDRCYRQAVEAISERLPQLHTVASFTWNRFKRTYLLNSMEIEKVVGID